MSRKAADIESLVAGELARQTSPQRRARMQSFLIPPRSRTLRWDYGQPDERIEAWVVGLTPDGGVALVYADAGFGPSFPWGFVFPEDDSAGMDSQWHSGLEDALICAGLLEAPSGYEVPGPR